MTNLDDARECEWGLEFFRTFANAEGNNIDMYWLRGGEGVGLSVPHGREDLAIFIARSILAGQQVLRANPTLTLEEFAPHLGFKKT